MYSTNLKSSFHCSVNYHHGTHYIKLYPHMAKTFLSIYQSQIFTTKSEENKLLRS